MPTYQAISDAELASGKPVSQSLLTRLRDNAIAIAEGDPSAPRIQQAAFQTSELNFYHFGSSVTNKTVSTTEQWRGGEHRYNNLTISAAGKIECIEPYTVIRVNGLLTLQGVIDATGDIRDRDHNQPLNFGEGDEDPMINSHPVCRILPRIGGGGGGGTGGNGSGSSRDGQIFGREDTLTSLETASDDYGGDADFERSLPVMLSGVFSGGGQGATSAMYGDYLRAAQFVPGGAGGGAIIICAREVNFTGSILASGGNYGSEVGYSDYGIPREAGGGGGGVAVIAYATLINNSGSVSINGGAGTSVGRHGGDGLAALINASTGTVTSI